MLRNRAESIYNGFTTGVTDRFNKASQNAISFYNTKSMNAEQSAIALYNGVHVSAEKGAMQLLNKARTAAGSLRDKVAAKVTAIFDAAAEKTGAVATKMKAEVTKFKEANPYVVATAKTVTKVGILFLMLVNPIHVFIGIISENALYEQAQSVSAAAKDFWANRSAPSKIVLGAIGLGVTAAVLSSVSLSTLAAATAFSLAWCASSNVMNGPIYNNLR